MKQRLAIFDFCGTLVNFQTANAFVDFIIQEQSSKLSRSIDLIWKILFNGKLLPPRIRQRFKLLKLKGISIKNLNHSAKKFVDQKLIPNENLTVIKRLKQHKKRGDIIVILSAGYYVYLKQYGKNYSVDYVIATKLKSQNHKLTGKIQGPECVGKNKLACLKQIINISDFDLPNSSAYTDNYQGDKSVLGLVGNQYSVSTQNNKSDVKKIS